MWSPMLFLDWPLEKGLHNVTEWTLPFSWSPPVLGLPCLVIIALNVRDWLKGKELFIKKLYRLKSNGIMSSLKPQSPLKHPQTHIVLPSALCLVQGTISQEKK